MIKEYGPFGDILGILVLSPPQQASPIKMIAMSRNYYRALNKAETNLSMN